MGLCFKITDAIFKKYVGIADIMDDPVTPDVYPVTDTLKGLYYLGGTAADSIADQSGNGNNATIIGDVAIAEAYATFTGKGAINHIRTPINTSVANKTTIVALFRVSNGFRSIVGNYDGSKYGFAFANGGVFCDCGGSYATKGYPDRVGTSNFVLCALSIDPTGCCVVKYSNGDVCELVRAEGAMTQWGQPFTIGGTYSNISYDGDADIAVVSIHEGDMTDAQLRQIFAYVHEYGTVNGLVID